MRLGETLIARKLITPEDLDRALELQKERGDKLGKTLVDLGFVAMRDVLAALSDQLGIPLITIDGPPAISAETETLSPKFLRQFRSFRSAWRIIRYGWRWPTRSISRPSPRCAPAPASASIPCSRRSRRSSTRSPAITASRTNPKTIR